MINIPGGKHDAKKLLLLDLLDLDGWKIIFQNIMVLLLIYPMVESKHHLKQIQDNGLKSTDLNWFARLHSHQQ